MAAEVNPPKKKFTEITIPVSKAPYVCPQCQKHHWSQKWTHVNPFREPTVLSFCSKNCKRVYMGYV